MNSPIPTRYLSTVPACVDALADADPQETQEWRDAFHSLVAAHGARRARFMLDELFALAQRADVRWAPKAGTAYVNTIAVDRQPDFPGDLSVEEKLGAIMRWNALAMVVRANAAYGRSEEHTAELQSLMRIS